GVTAARQALVDDVLNARFQDPHAVLVRARALGLDLDGLRVVVLVAVDDFERFYLQHEREGEAYFQRLRGTVSLLLRQEAQRVSAHGAVVPLGDAAVALLPGLDAARTVATEVAARARRELRLVPVVVGVGGEKTAWTQLSASYREAVLALRLRRRLRLRTRHVAFADVTGAALLELLEHTPEVRGLLSGAIAPLVAADRAHRSRLVETLAAWFDAGTSLKQAASALGVHPKTLRYRMDRIGDLLGQDAFEGDRRLLYYVAARLHLWTQG
ncbi:MAG: helix-turn-helix domain-containing protein, partial [Trueperaceae bacterium]|nr:helix-turn-helix domain-containing protein [Trueperaceae bacterium]